MSDQEKQNERLIAICATAGLSLATAAFFVNLMGIVPTHQWVLMVAAAAGLALPAAPMIHLSSDAATPE